MKQTKMKKAISTLFTSILVVLFFTVAFMVMVTNASGGDPQIAGYQVKSVLSGSMEPDIKTGSVIVVKQVEDKTNFVEGDVITFLESDQGILVTHRITDVIKSGEHILYETKGDNNDAVDLIPVLSDNVVAEYKGITIPYVGYLINMSSSKNGALFLLLPGVLLLIYSGTMMWKAISRIETSKKENEVDEPL